MKPSHQLEPIPKSNQGNHCGQHNSYTEIPDLVCHGQLMTHVCHAPVLVVDLPKTAVWPLPWKQHNWNLANLQGLGPLVLCGAVIPHLCAVPPTKSMPGSGHWLDNLGPSQIKHCSTLR